MRKIEKISKTAFSFMAALVMMLSIFGCTSYALNSEGASDKSKPVDSATTIAWAESTNLVMSVGQANQRTATATPADKEITYTSSNTAVAKVNANGNVFCLSAGETVITATSGKKSVSYKLTVTDEYAAPSSAVAVPVSTEPTPASAAKVPVARASMEVLNKPADSAPETDSKKLSSETSHKRKASSDDETTSNEKTHASSITYSINTTEVKLTAGEGYQLSVNTSDLSKGMSVKWLIPSVLSNIITIDDSGYVTTYHRDGLASANATITVLANVYRSGKLVETLHCTIIVTQ